MSWEEPSQDYDEDFVQEWLVTRDIGEIDEWMLRTDAPDSSDSWDSSGLADRRFASDALQQVFNQLATRWQCETLVESSTYRVLLHPDYQRIIGLGEPALPLILNRLQSDGDLWFWALESISGAQPAQDVDTYEEAVQAWLSWGRAQGYAV